MTSNRLSKRTSQFHTASLFILQEKKRKSFSNTGTSLAGSNGGNQHFLTNEVIVDKSQFSAPWVFTQAERLSIEVKCQEMQLFNPSSGKKQLVMEEKRT